MSDDAHLGIDVDSSSVAEAAINLDRLAQAAVRAGDGVDFMTASSRVQGSIWNENLQAIENNIASLQRQLAAENAAAAGTVQATGHYAAQTEQLHNLRFATANVAAQFQDILVTSQMGQSPFTIALQQGTQLSQVMQLMAGGQGGGGIIATLRASFASLLSPISLITIGLVGLAAWGVESFMKLSGVGQTFAKQLKEQNDALKEITAGYKEAGSAADDYYKHIQQRPVASVLSDLQKQFEEISKQSEGFKTDIGLFQALGGSANGEVNRVFDSFLKGQITTRELSSDLTQIVNTTKDLDPVTAAFVKHLADAALMARDVKDLVIEMDQVAAGVGHSDDTQYALDQSIAGKRAAEGHKIEMDAINAKTPAQLADIARRREALSLADSTISTSQQQARVEAAGATAYKEASTAIYEANQSRLRGLNDNIKSAKTELETVGMTVRETSRLQFLRQQMQSAEDEAAQRHGSVSPEVSKAIQDAADQYGALQEKIQGAQLTIADESPWDSLQRKLKENQDLLDDNAISWDTWSQEVGKSVEEAVGKYSDISNNLLGSWSTFNDAMDKMGQERLSTERDNFEAQGLSGQDAVDAQKKLNADIASEGQRSFNAAKELAIARAVVSGAEAVVHAYNAGSQLPGGPITGAIFAGIAAAAVGAQIASIASSTYHSKSLSSPVSGAASAGGSDGAGGAGGGGSLNIVISGSGAISADDFARQLASGLADGAHPELGYQITVARQAA